MMISMTCCAIGVKGLSGLESASVVPDYARTAVVAMS